MLLIGRHFGHWASLKHFIAANPGMSGRKALGLVALGQASLCKPKLYRHQTAELDHKGQWIVRMRDEKHCAQIHPVPNPVSVEMANKYNSELPRCGLR